MADSELEDQIREYLSGVILHRRRHFTPFAHVPDQPLIDVLYSITRPTDARPVQNAPVAEPQSDAAASQDAYVMPKAMVPYRSGQERIR